jgi:hypothetical protein
VLNSVVCWWITFGSTVSDLLAQRVGIIVAKTEQKTRVNGISAATHLDSRRLGILPRESDYMADLRELETHGYTLTPQAPGSVWQPQHCE